MSEIKMVPIPDYDDLKDANERVKKLKEEISKIMGIPSEYLFKGFPRAENSTQHIHKVINTFLNEKLLPILEDHVRGKRNG